MGGRIIYATDHLAVEPAYHRLLPRNHWISAWAPAEVGAVSMVGGAIAWKTNVMTTAIMLYTNRGDFSLGIALGLILMVISMCINASITLVQRRLSK